MNTIKLIVISAVVFLLMDALWLGVVAKGFYMKHMGSFLAVKDGGFEVNILAAVIVYIALIGGLVIFVQPLAGHNVWAALGYGMLFGFVTYGTYDFTNMAVLKDWSWYVSIVDVIWGMVICGVTSMVACFFK